MQPPVAPWAFEIVGPILWFVIAAYFFRQTRRTGSLSVPALVFIGATSMFWLEWYGDWAAYILYNPSLHLIDGWNLPLTTGNKPWAVLPAYGWFFGLIYFPLIEAVRWGYNHIAGRPDVDRPAAPSGGSPSPRPMPTPDTGGVATVAVVDAPAPVLHQVRRRLPSFAITLFVVGLFAHYLWDLLIEGVATQWGLWSYVDTVGPAISGSRGTFPLLYPVIPFAIQMSLTMVLIDSRRPDGTPTVEAWMRVHRFTGAKRTAMRVLTWILTMNLTYIVLFIGPITIIRALFLPTNNLVP